MTPDEERELRASIEAEIREHWPIAVTDAYQRGWNDATDRAALIARLPKPVQVG